MTVCTIQRVMKPVGKPPEGPTEAAGMGDDALRVCSPRCAMKLRGLSMWQLAEPGTASCTVVISEIITSFAGWLGLWRGMAPATGLVPACLIAAMAQALLQSDPWNVSLSPCCLSAALAWQRCAAGAAPAAAEAGLNSKQDEAWVSIRVSGD